MSTIIGIDASLTGTGVAVIDNGKMKNHERIESKQTGVRRLIEIESRLKYIIDSQLLVNTKTDMVVIEEYAWGAKGRATYQIGELGGVIRRMLHHQMVRWIEVNPSHVKKFAAGSGNAKKEQVLMQVYKRWGIEFATSDEADAFVLAKIGEVLLGIKTGNWTGHLTTFQTEVIMELLKKYKEVLS
jgi:crossover junction endodeoxyribonuclease RuvC